MITEDYVSFETAKLLKEKGFDEECVYVYRHDGSEDIWDADKEDIACQKPTLQMAMKWLREVHNLVIEPYRTACGYLYTISSIPYGSTKYDNSEAYNGDDEDSGQWTTWEKACEDGIEYCLKNLI
ncbi:MAG: hypothetical protein J6T10_13010 [Methanobrevibacter sp.]|nr:hypothetical protein [Methanobrevibacter sp.]